MTSWERADQHEAEEADPPWPEPIELPVDDTERRRRFDITRFREVCIAAMVFGGFLGWGYVR